MIFTSFTYFYFFVFVFILYWTIPKKGTQNIILLIASYVFYGWIHPWFCILIGVSTITDYLCGIRIKSHEKKRKLYLVISLVVNLGMLGFFKYFNFFVDNVYEILSIFRLSVDPIILKIFLPVGISFYTFQTLSYTIDIYKGKLEPRKNFIDFAVFVSFFPQLVAGPIERASHFLPQVEKKRSFHISILETAIPLIIRGYLKKLVIADNVAVYANKVYMLESPSFLLLLAGTLAFTIQIYADFSAYTDIARGSAKLLGFDLIKNFKNPYLAISPSDFWRRWHISFSSWIRDYLYISLGGSRVKTATKFAFVLIVTMGLSGLWHGAAWNFVLWGIYHGVLVFVYHKLGMGGRWKPQGRVKHFFAWFIMSCFTVFGWMLFRTPEMSWLIETFRNFSLTGGKDALISSIVIVLFTAAYTIPLALLSFIDALPKKYGWVNSAIYGLSVVIILLFFRESGQDFIYFQF